MPRFVRNLSENGKEILSMNEVLNYLLRSFVPLVNQEDLPDIMAMGNEVSKQLFPFLNDFLL